MRGEEYQTKNLNIASYLYASGIQFNGTSKVGKEFFFRFEPKFQAEELVNKYFLNKATINPKELFSRLHDLKDIIFNQKYE